MACVAEREEAEQLAAEFPGWHIWRSSKGWWYATRRGNIPARRDRPPEWTMTADGADAAQLRKQLTIQDELPDSAAI